MKRLVQIGIVILLSVIIAFLHPLDLVMPWQSGRPGPLEITMHRIMAGDQYELVESDWGRTTPFNYVAVTGQFRTSGSASNTCTDLRRSLEEWGRVSEITRHNEGCDIKARGPGPMKARIDVAEDPELQRALRIEIRVQHSS